MESSGGGPEEEAVISVAEDGRIDVVVGTFSHGQGHRTTYAQILSETLGVDFEDINIIQGDTDVVAFGGGTGGSRSSQMGGIAVQRAGLAMVEDAKNIAAELIQTPVEQVPIFIPPPFVLLWGTSCTSVPKSRNCVTEMPRLLVSLMLQPRLRYFAGSS